MINMPGFHPVDISYYLNSTSLMNTWNSIFRKLKYKPRIVFVQALTLNYISYTLFPEVYFNTYFHYFLHCQTIYIEVVFNYTKG